jgi:hypothetical protein
VPRPCITSLICSTAARSRFGASSEITIAATATLITDAPPWTGADLTKRRTCATSNSSNAAALSTLTSSANSSFSTSPTLCVADSSDRSTSDRTSRATIVAAVRVLDPLVLLVPGPVQSASPIPGSRQRTRLLAHIPRRHRNLHHVSN